MSPLIPTLSSIETNASNIVSFPPLIDDCAELAGSVQREDPSGEMPAGFLNREDGIYQLRPTEGGEILVRLCSPILVRGICRSPGGRGWGRVIEVFDPDGRRHKHVIDEALLAGKPEALLRPLFDLGLVLEPIDKSAQSVQQFLRAWRPKARFTRVHACGWVDEAQQSFVLTNGKVVGENQMVVTDGLVRAATAAAAEGGTLESWRRSIGALCVGNSLMMLAVSHALTGPLLRPLSMEGGGFHLRGASSMGKTTIQKVAVSIWGGPAFLQSWRATDNGIEGLAAAHNNTLLVLNELAEVCPSKLGDIIYLLGNGQGKVRARQDGSIAPGATWRVPLLSSGEISPVAHMRSAGKRIRAGQEVRLIDICADNRSHGAFDCLHDLEGSAAFAEHLERLAATHHGTIGPAFVCALIENIGLIDLARKLLDDFCDIALRQIDVVPDGQTRRVLRRFMLAAVAGEIATKLAIIGWQRGAAFLAARDEFRRWLQDNNAATGSDISNAIAPTREYLDANRHRLVAVGQRCAPGDPGWFDEQYFYLLRETWSAIHSGDAVDAARLHKAAGLLLSSNNGKGLQFKMPRGVQGRPLVYAIKAEVLSWTATQ